MKIKRIGVAAIALAAAGALTLTGCTSGSPSSSGAAGDSSAIITTNGSEPQNPLIPTNTNEVGGGKILDAIFAGLVYYDAKGAVHNDVAESIESDDAQNYTIKIKPDLKFTNGDPVNAESFVKAWNYGAALDNAQLSSYFFGDIEGFSLDENRPELSGLKVVDDLTFTVALVQPESDFPLSLGYSAFYPLPESAWEDLDAFGENPVGNGPYMLDGEGAWKHNEEISLVTNPDYDGPRKAQNGGLDIIFYASQDASYADLQGGNVDVVDQIPEAALASYADEFPDRSVNQAAAIFQSFTIPARLPHFSGEEGQLRRAAISMAINREEITDVIFEGTRTPAHDFTSPVIDGYSEDVPGSEVLEFNPEKAKELWAQADAIAPWSGTFQIAYNADGGHQGWVDAVSNQLKNNLGIDASGNPYPTFAEARTEITNRTIQTAFRSGWQADYPALFNFLGPLYGTGAGSNDGDYSNPEVDALLKEGRAETDIDAANEKFQQVQEILFKDLPAVPLWYSNVNGAWNDTVDNVEFGWNSVPLYYQITKAAE
ncbi:MULTISPECIES: ABC transporter substrate-binding protein [Agromyces]|uniref:ABC transporter substrate-binding protein n=1 Tax=Agromyces mediolanus TaxID=41986 RepID=A0A918CGN0_AGRME|nr:MULTISPECIES: ABC transporter substrate-binding protein [Agromyces]GGR21900.1 ABC transporter substrate-binding protein [Agromyces mediolanus]GLJ73876.1 ABC transporter substrate-binding protein [Agromyces mediolanus]GLU89510.1 ABC transporter substrate-binding protein [Agromyces sp. NBRC 114283]